MENKHYPILVVDDETIIRLFAVAVLRSEFDMDVLQAGTVDDAVRLACEHRPPFVLMDIHLNEERTGIDAAREIMKYYQPKIFIVSAYDADDFIAPGDRETFSGFYSKPISKGDLVAILSDYAAAT